MKSTQTKEPAFTGLGQGLYRHNPTGNLYHRPKIDGKKTWRRLPTQRVSEARDVMAKRRTDKLMAVEGLRRDPDLPPVFDTVGEAITHWVEAGCPGKDRMARQGQALKRSTRLAERMLEWWKHHPIGSVRPALIERYAQWRRDNSPKSKAGGTRLKTGHCLDKEMFLLFHAFQLARRKERLVANPMSGFEPVKLMTSKEVRHCRDCRPLNADELHLLARNFFTSSERSEVLGWQLLIEALTGVRTAEILDCRMDATAHGQAGFIDGNILHINRRKRGVNPWIPVHPALRECLDAFQAWHRFRFPDSPWWFPSSVNPGERASKEWPRPARYGAQPINKCALNSALYLKGAKWLGAGRKITSHGMRAYYVTARRSEGIADVIIAHEIGDTTGAAIITATYGGLPPNWLDTTVGKIGWLPVNGKPAWAVFNHMKRNIITLPAPEMAQAI